MNKYKLIYITYQTFPAKTANSIQTISNIKYLLKNNTEVDLYFPLREKNSSSNLEVLQKQYSFNFYMNIFGIKHNYPHGKVKIFKNIFYNLSHYFWSKSTVRKLFKNDKSNTFFTRSDWIAFFLAKQGSKVVFEVHQVSKVRNYVIRKIKLYKNVKFIFLNKELSDFYMNPSRSIVLHNGVDDSLFSISTSLKKPNHILYAGTISRFNQPRGIKEIINWFTHNYLKQNFTLEIVGANEQEINELNNMINFLDLKQNILVYGWTNKEAVIKKIERASIGLLINSKINLHSTHFTSPLKYFEYLYGNLNVVAVNFPAHRSLPMSDQICFYEDSNQDSFLKAVQLASISNKIDRSQIKSLTLDTRAKKIIEFIF